MHGPADEVVERECMHEVGVMKGVRKLLAPERVSLGAKVTRNVVYNAARSILLAPLPFLLIPFFLKKLGSAGYGTWAVFLAINSMTSLADFGLLTSISKHVAQFYALKDFRALGQIISTGLLLYLGIACALAGALWASARVLMGWFFRNSPVPTTELMILWKLVICLAFANVLTLFFSSVVLGLQRMDVSSTMNTLNSALSAGLSVGFLWHGLGLRGVLYGYEAAAWVVTLAYAYATLRLLPEVRLTPMSCRWKVAREILSFSTQAYVTQIAVAIHNQIEKFYLARFVGLVPVGWYDVSSDLALKLRSIPSLVLTPIMPAASELDALNDHERLESLYFRAHKYLAFLGVPLVAYVSFVSKRFVDLWVGPSLEIIAIPICVLLITNFINLSTGPGFLILLGRGNLRPGLYSAILGIVLNLTLSLILIHAYGFKGAVIGTSVSLCSASIFFLLEFQKQTKTSLISLVRFAYVKPLLASLFALSFVWILRRLVETSLITLFAGAAIFGLAYFLTLLLLRFFDSFDLSTIETVVRLPSFFRRIVPNAELGGSLLSDRESAQATSEWE